MEYRSTLRLLYQKKRLQVAAMRSGRIGKGVPRLLCAKTRFVSIAAIPHILFHMCRQIGFALRATTKRGGLPSGFAAGMACRRFDLKVELQAIRLPFDIPAPSTFVKRRRAIPTFGSRQAPRHEPGFARHEYPRMNQCKTSSQGVSFYTGLTGFTRFLQCASVFGDFIILIIL